MSGKMLQIDDFVVILHCKMTIKTLKLGISCCGGAMKFVKRRLTPLVEHSLETDRVTALMGPRQSGKTTLARHLLKTDRELKYYNLKDPEIRQILKKNARKEFALFRNATIILDEVQTVPQLLEYVQLQVDDAPQKRGQFLLLGSNHLLLNRHIKESLAGRVALFTLLPLGLTEILESENLTLFEKLLAADDQSACMSLLDNEYVPLEQHRRNSQALDEMNLYGGYPEFLFRKATDDRKAWLNNYHQTYLETDLRQLVDLRNTESFEVFEKLFAMRTGNLLNISELARDCGLSADTIRRFISYYKQLFVCWQLRPYFANLGKRMMKMSKYYFFDSGLLRAVLGDFSGESGNVFENTVLAEMKKLLCATGAIQELNFCRTSTGVEADAFVKSDNGKFAMFFEIKQSAHADKKSIRHLKKYVAANENSIGILINNGSDIIKMEDRIWVVPAAWMFG